MKIDPIKYYVRFNSAQLYSVNKRNYFTYNGIIYKLTAAMLKKVLNDIKIVFNPETSANMLIDMAKKNKFTCITKKTISRNQLLSNIINKL